MSTLCSLYMTGVIWMVQLAHYPLMAHIGDESFKGYQTANLPSTTWVVMPTMILEVVSAAGQFFALFKTNFEAPFLALHLVSLGSLILIWLSTFFLQVPLHQKLLDKKDEFLIRKLVNTNWLRTLGWSLRSLIFIFLLFEFHSP